MLEPVVFRFHGSRYGVLGSSVPHDHSGEGMMGIPAVSRKPTHAMLRPAMAAPVLAQANLVLVRASSVLSFANFSLFFDMRLTHFFSMNGI